MLKFPLRDSPVRIRSGRMMRSRSGVAVRALCIALAAVAGWLPQGLDAQVRAGGYGVYQTGVFEGSYGFGGRAEVAMDFIAPNLTFAGTYDHFFPDCADCSAFNAGAQVLLAPPRALYLGLGADYHRFSDGQADGTTSSDWSMNLIAGIRIPVLPMVVPFFEFRQQIWSTTINELTLSLGVVFSPGAARNAPRRPRAR